MLTTSKAAADGEADADEVHGSHGRVGDADPRALEPWDRRAAAGNLATALGGRHEQAAQALLQGLSLWLDAKVHVVLSVDEREAGFCLGLTDEMGLGMHSVYFDVEVHDPRARRRRGQRIRGIGDFADLRQLYMRWRIPDGN